MSYSDKIATFLEAPTTEYDHINMDDLELVAGDVIERVRSQPNSPIGKHMISFILWTGANTNLSVPNILIIVEYFPVAGKQPEFLPHLNSLYIE